MAPRASRLDVMIAAMIAGVAPGPVAVVARGAYQWTDVYGMGSVSPSLAFGAAAGVATWGLLRLAARIAGMTLRRSWWLVLMAVTVVLGAIATAAAASAGS